MTVPRNASTTHAIDTLLTAIGAAPDALALFATASEQLRRLIAYDASVWRATDPVTGMMTSPIRVENLTEEGCSVYWESELLSENINLFRDLARAPLPVAGLREATGGLPGRSALYRDFLAPRGLDDELRAVLRVGGHPWGQVSLFRAQGAPAFGADDTLVVKELSAAMARRLRSFTEPSASAGPTPSHGPGPGLLLFDASGRLLSVNDEARELLDDIVPGPTTPTPLGVSVPAWMHSTASKARAIAAGWDKGVARVRVRSKGGRWLACHASCLRGADGELGASAVVIERASISEVAPLMVKAYELTDRELEITQHIARGLGTAEMAGKLFLSPHTVRDHVKAIFEKVRVSSRGELVAKLFTEHYAPLGEESEQRVWG
ncbi:LuxR C-terminal-related transcriptional regulator [Streptomyces sp. NBC_00648]|uniref:LuxR C-terminal-related transcriptional regulator n=1 Tax=Streptomyces sp. NBC_00648 TaxID=2975797 RepID=UPI003245BB85